MTTQQTLVYGIDEIGVAVAHLYALFDRCSVFTFTGTLGAGKTTLVQALLRGCHITEVITSPTFTYVNSYENRQGQLFYHFDLYRLSSCEEFVALGFDEYLYQPHSWSFIEWPEVIMPLLKKRVCHVTLDYEGFEKRRMTYRVIDAS